MFVERHASEMDTCMCWGFACGDGWFNILNKLCANIQSHIDHKNRQHARELAKQQAYNEGYEALVKFYQGKAASPSEWHEELAQSTLEQGVIVPDKVEQVVVEQVKEKFGTLRFYYRGGDDYISGLVSMAESMTGVTCESCGNPGEQRGNGWIHTYCQMCEDQRNKE